MKKATTLLFTLILFGITVFSQETKTVYKTVENIYYRNPADKNITDYMKERCVLDVYYPENVDSFTTVVWFHGGGITGGDKYIPEPLKEKNIAIVAVRYRLSPKVKCPTYIDDAAAAVAWVYKNIETYGGLKSRVFVSGHSAGGYLTSMVGMDKRYLEKYGVDANDLAGLIPFSGHTITHFTVRAERGIPGTQPIIDEFAPLYHVRADAPPLLLITGDREKEMLGRYEENAYMYRMMLVAGHKNTTIYELGGYGHGIVDPACKLLLDFIKKIE